MNDACLSGQAASNLLIEMTDGHDKIPLDSKIHTDRIKYHYTDRIKYHWIVGTQNKIPLDSRYTQIA